MLEIVNCEREKNEAFLLLLPDGVKVSSRDCCLLCWAENDFASVEKERKQKIILYCIYHTNNKKTTKKI